MQLIPHIYSETESLKTVIVGRADDRFDEPTFNNPKITESVEKGIYPDESELKTEVDAFVAVLESFGVEVLRPKKISSQDQIFTRDIGFVVGNTFVVSRMRKENRRPEIEGVRYVLASFQGESILEPPAGVFIEGGDVLVHRNKVFVGQGERTNEAAVSFLMSNFPDFEIIPVSLTVTDDPYTNILHLDCAFQPIGDKYAVWYPKGFKNYPKEIVRAFGRENLIEVSQQEMYDMVPNIFSINEQTVISDYTFSKFNQSLEKRGIKVAAINYRSVSRLGGLLRCSTLPLIRKATV